METQIRTRFAPSPTGFLHIGGVRTSLYCYALAKRNNGQFLVRVEDTDENRFVEGASEEIFEMLKEYGLEPDESPVHGGEYGPYTQSERKDIYKKYAEQLVESGNAYYCFLEGEELKTLQEHFKGKGFRSTYREQDLEISRKMIAEGKPYVIRLKVPENEIIEYSDGLQGNIKFDTDNVGDEVLIKTSGMGSYHLAVVVDDYLMKISHVLRGAEWVSSTPKQILIHRFLGLEMPPYYHFPVILDPDGGKLSKRKGTVSARAFLEEGYLPEAILNFLMLIGWSAPIERVHGEREREMFTLKEFVELFDLKDLNNTNAIFDRQKLLYFNKEYIKSIPDLEEKFRHWLEKFSQDKSLLESVQNDKDLQSKLALVKERSTTLVDILNQIKFFYSAKQNIDWEIKQLSKLKNEKLRIKNELLEFHKGLDEDSSKWTHEEWENGIRGIAEKLEEKAGDVFMVLRVSIVGEPFSPPLFEALQILGKEEVIKRLNS